MVRLESHFQGTILPVRAQPGARRQGVLGEHDGALRVAVTAAPDKGKANQAIAKILGTSLGIPKSDVELVGGASSRQKRFLLRGMSLEQAVAALDRLLNSGQ
jgi:uncharacterized protein (TIGR00251 family)